MQEEKQPSSSIAPKLVTSLLDRWHTHGKQEDFDALIETTYLYLKKIAANLVKKDAGVDQLNQYLTPTEVVHTAFEDLKKIRHLKLENRIHFYNVCAKIFRHKIIEAIRKEGADKRGGKVAMVTLDSLAVRVEKPAHSPDLDEYLLIDKLLEKLETIDLNASLVFSCRFFLGNTIDEIHQMSSLSKSTVKRKWNFAKVWMEAELHEHRAR